MLTTLSAAKMLKDEGYKAIEADRLTDRNLSLSVNGSTGQAVQTIVSSVQPFGMVHLFVTSTVLGVIILATVVGNVFVIAAIVLERNLRNVANYLIASLAVADLLVAVLVMPLGAVKEVSSVWFLGPEVCDMWTSFDVLCCTSSILHLVAISLDRYWVVTRVEYLHNRSPQRILLMIGLSWGVSAVISIPPLLGWKSPQGDLNLTGQCVISQDLGYTIFSTVGAFYLPLISMMIIYLKVFKAARSRIRKHQFKRPDRKGIQEADSVSLVECSIPGSTVMTSYRSVDDTKLLKIVTTFSSSAGRFSSRVVQESNGVSSDSLSTSIGPEDDDSNRPYSSATSSRVASFNSPPDKACQAMALYTHSTASPPTSVLRYIRATEKDSPTRRKIRDTENRKTELKLSKEKLEQKRERKAARTLVIVTGSFVACWLPFFIVATISPFCGDNCSYPFYLLSVIVWLGYCNSLLNPIIYTIFNPDFRMAFRKIIFGKYKRNIYRSAL